MTTGGRTGGLPRRAQRGAATPRVLLALVASTVVTAAVAGPMAYQAREARQAADASTPVTVRTTSTTTTTTEAPGSAPPSAVLPATTERDGSIALVWARSWETRADTPVADATVSGRVFIYLRDSGASGLTSARFWLDDPEGASAPLHEDQQAPFTVVAGPSQDRPGALDTATLADGRHSVLVELVFDTTTVRRVATFSVDNG